MGLFLFNDDEGTRLWRSTDAFNWQEVPLPAEMAASDVRKVVWGHNHLVASLYNKFSSSQELWTSTDGETWRRVLGSGRLASPVIDETTLRKLAGVAQSQAIKWSEPHPRNIRVALGTQSAAEAIGVTFGFGESSPRFVIALDGRFVCRPPTCATSGGGGPNPNPTTTTATTQPPVMTMLLTVDPSTLSPDLSVAVRYRDVDLSTLGRVYALDSYLGG
jgi:hypothetical protein